MHVTNSKLHGTPDGLQSISDAIQRNCHIVDARHASDYTMCVYLLKMREYFRWEKGYEFGAALPREEIGDWLRERESLWEDLENADYAAIPIEGDAVDPFAADRINAFLTDHGLVYSAGLGSHSRPHFFLGKLLGCEQRCGFDIYISDTEYVRELTAYPAMSLNKTIYVRRESIRRMIWEKLEEWHFQQRDNAMRRAVQAYGFDGDLTAILDNMTDDVMELAIWHEMGEVMAGEWLGESWHGMLHRLKRSKLELMLRAVRDHLADALCALPGLVKQGPDALVHYYFATFSGMRKELAPAMLQAYQRYTDGGSDLSRVIDDSVQHWQRVAMDAVAVYQANPDQPDTAAIEQLIAQNTFR